MLILHKLGSFQIILVIFSVHIFVHFILLCIKQIVDKTDSLNLVFLSNL